MIFDLCQFAKLGCTMVLWDVNTAGNEETKAMVRATGATVRCDYVNKYWKYSNQVYSYTVDISKRDQINATAVANEVGVVSILVRNSLPTAIFHVIFAEKLMGIFVVFVGRCSTPYQNRRLCWK